MLRVLLVLLLLPALVAAAVPTTNVTGSFNLPSGTNPTNVTLTLTPSEAFQVTDATGNKYQIPAIPQVFSIPASGSVSINVIPNTGASNSPDQTYYRVKIQAGRYVDESLTWQVGYNANGVNLADVDVAAPSTATQSFLELVGGTLTGILNLAASPGIRFVPSAEPTGTAAGQAYVNGSDYKLYIYNGLGSWIAATGAGLTSVFHYTDLTGSGTSSSPIRITPGAAGSVMLTNTAGTTVTATALTGDVTVNGSGVTAIGAGKVISSHFADNSITAVKLSPTAGITTTQIQDETLTGSDVANNSLTAVELSPTAGITTTQIQNETLTGSDVANSSLTAVDLSPTAGITGTQISSLPNAAANVSGDWTNTPVGTNWILPANKILQIVGGSADPGVVGGFNYDTDTKAFTVKSDIGVQSIVGTWFVQTSDSSAIANTASETDFDQLPPSFPANSLKAGRTIMWLATYIASTTGTPTLRIRHKFGSVTISDTTGYTTSSGMTNRALTLQGKMTIRTVGASGTYLADITYGPITLNSTGQYISSSGPTSEFGTVGATIDTTAGNVLKDTAQWSAGSPSNTIKRVALTVAVY